MNFGSPRAAPAKRYTDIASKFLAMYKRWFLYGIASFGFVVLFWGATNNNMSLGLAGGALIVPLCTIAFDEHLTRRIKEKVKENDSVQRSQIIRPAKLVLSWMLLACTFVVVLIALFVISRG